MLAVTKFETLAIVMLSSNDRNLEWKRHQDDKKKIKLQNIQNMIERNVSYRIAGNHHKVCRGDHSRIITCIWIILKSFEFNYKNEIF